MDWGTLSPVIVSVGVVTAIVTAIASIIVSIINTKKQKQIALINNEANKSVRLSEYRYTQLYSILQKISSKPAPIVSVVNDHDQRTMVFMDNDRLSALEFYSANKPMPIEQVHEQREKVVEMYILAKPFIDKSIRVELDNLAKLERMKFISLVKISMANNSDITSSIIDWINCFVKLNEELKMSLHSQISILTKVK